MKLSKNNSNLHPKTVKLTDGTKITTIRQKYIKTKWIHDHGCSLIAESYALQWLGIDTTDLDNLYKLHKKNTDGYNSAKVRLIALPVVINKLAKGRGTSKYYKTPTIDRITKALKDGCLVIFEQRTKSSGNIHTVTFIRDDGTNYVLNNGTATKVSISSKVNTELCKDSKYKGMVVVKRNVGTDLTTTINYPDDEVDVEENVLTFKKVKDFNSKAYATGTNKYYHSPLNPYEYYNSKIGTYGDCTWTAYGRFIEVWGEAPKAEQKAHPMHGWFAGNAYNWATSAKSLGYETGTKPRLGAIICWGYGSATGGFGHVAFVEDIKYDKKGNVTSIEVSQSGWSVGDMKNQTLKPGDGNKGTGAYKLGFNNSYFNGFIYNPITFGKSGSGSSSSSDEEIIGSGIDMQTRASKLVSSNNYSFITSEKEEQTEQQPQSTTSKYIQSFKNALTKQTQDTIVDIISNLTVSLTKLVTDAFATVINTVIEKINLQNLRQVNNVLSIADNTVEAPFIELDLKGYKIGSYHGSLDEYPNYVNSLTVVKQNGVINQYQIQLIHQIRTGDDPNLLDELFATIGYDRISIKYGDANSGTYFQDNNAIITNITMNRNYTSMVISYTLEALSEGALVQTYTTTFPAVTDKPSNVLRDVIYNKGEVSNIIQDAFPGMKNKTLVESAGLIPTNDAVVHLDAQKNVNPIDYINYLVGNMSNAWQTGANLIVDSVTEAFSTGVDFISNSVGEALSVTTTNNTNVNANELLPSFYSLNEVTRQARDEALLNVDKQRREQENILRDSTYYVTYNDKDNTNPDGAYIKVSEVKANNSIYGITQDVYEITVGYPDDIIYQFNVDNTESWELLYKNNEKITEYFYTITDNGDINKYYSPTLNSSSNVISELTKNWWTQMVRFPITATLEIKGLMRPAMLMSYIRINVLFYGQRHVTSGIYAVTGQTDSLGPSGYKTTLSLVRVGE